MAAEGAPITLRLSAYGRPARSHVAAAQGLADERKHAEVEPIHLLYALADRDEATREALEHAGGEPDDVLVESELCLRRLAARAAGPAYLSPRMLDLLSRAEGEAARDGGTPVSTAHLLLATAQAQSGDARRVLLACGVSAPTLRAALSPSRSEARASGPAPISTDLTGQARSGQLGPIVGRDPELQRVIQVLARRTTSSPLLVGEPGVGKHSIVEALCSRIVLGDVPTMLQDKRVLQLEVTRLLSGARGRGDVEERLQRFLTAIRDTGGEVIVYVRDLAALLGERNAPITGQILGSALRDSGLRVLATADPASHKRLLEGTELDRHFVRVDIAAPDEAGTVAMLRARVAGFEAAHGLRIADPALLAAAHLCRRYVRDAQLPKSALDLIDEAAARLRVEVQSVPRSIDDKRRRLSSVAIELGALADDADAQSREHTAALTEEQSATRQALAELEDRWQQELAALAEVNRLKQEIYAVEQQLASSDPDSNATQRLRSETLATLHRQLREAEVHLAERPRMVREAVEPQDVAAVVADWTGVPVARMLEGEADKLLQMEERIGQRVIGQARAIGAVSRAVRRGRVGLRDTHKPIGSFLFLGTSGVGKTELAKALAEFLFDDESALTRLDMSEFMEKHTVARLLGAPPGYADSEAGGFLTEAVRRRPYSVLLFDEVEKAHPDVFNILLQVLDDGRLTDARGQLAHFSDCVILLTSNLGASALLERESTDDSNPGAADDRLPLAVQEALSSHFRPEFLNRIDEIVVFDTLGRQELARILELQLRRLSTWLAPRGLSLSLTPEAKELLVEAGYDPAYGARPLARAVQRHLQDPLSEAILGGAHGDGGTLQVDVHGGELRIH